MQAVRANSTRWRWAVIAAIGAALWCTGCARLKPYEREHHASRVMAQDDASERKLDGHVEEYREGSIGGDGVGGGGCGCN